MPQVRERSHTRHAKGEGRFGRGDVLHSPADGMQFAVVYFTQEQERDVHTLGRYPLHVRTGLREVVSKRGGVVANLLADIDADECAGTWHVVSPPKWLCVKLHRQHLTISRNSPVQLI